LDGPGEGAELMEGADVGWSTGAEVGGDIGGVGVIGDDVRLARLDIIRPPILSPLWKLPSPLWKLPVLCRARCLSRFSDACAS
jgi:hypothetical protein